MEYLEMLACLGAGSAHPGGFSATIRQLNEMPIPDDSVILEVGCGTGRTACYLAKQQKRAITAIDVREDMLVKARKRAEEEGVEVNFMQADVCSLPFDNDQFDMILAESVTNFAGAEEALKEYYRVLKPGGILYDREMMISEEMPDDLYRTITDFYKIKKLFTSEQWVKLLDQQQYQESQIWDLSKFPENMWEEEMKYPDRLQMADENAFMNPELQSTIRKYDEIMFRGLDYFRYGVVSGKK